MAEEKLVNQDSWKNAGALKIAERDPRWRAGYERGLLNDPITEPLPKRINTKGEQVTQNGNAHLVLGRDRTGSRASGYGGAGATQSSAIDICVGMGNGSNPGPATAEYVDPNFKGDSARIYISQRTNIDEAFRLITPESNSSIGNSENQSGIGIKADSVRVIGVNGIKLISRPQNKDSRDGTAVYGGIELVACNDQKSLQYMVKGDNLLEALTVLEKRLTALSAIVMTFLATQIKFNTALAGHSHTGTGAGATGPIAVQTFPDPAVAGAAMDTIMKECEATVDNLKERLNLNLNWHQSYLSGADDTKYILSRYNKVN